jgi:hypothetical protein
LTRTPIGCIKNNKLKGVDRLLDFLPPFHLTSRFLPGNGAEFLKRTHTKQGIMDALNWSQNKEKREQEALERHKELSRLFREDRFAFERERKRLIEEVINSTDDPCQRERLRELQEKWNRRMKGAGCKHNRFVLAQTFFWEHVREVWQPTLQKAHRALDRWKD